MSSTTVYSTSITDTRPISFLFPKLHVSGEDMKKLLLSKLSGITKIAMKNSFDGLREV